MCVWRACLQEVLFRVGLLARPTADSPRAGAGKKAQ
jgi:hypothetical protein